MKPPRRAPDAEAVIMGRIIELLRQLDPAAQRRVAAYCADRAESIGPHLPAISNATQDPALPLESTPP